MREELPDEDPETDFGETRPAFHIFIGAPFSKKEYDISSMREAYLHFSRSRAYTSKSLSVDSKMEGHITMLHQRISSHL